MKDGLAGIVTKSGSNVVDISQIAMARGVEFDPIRTLEDYFTKGSVKHYQELKQTDKDYMKENPDMYIATISSAEVANCNRFFRLLNTKAHSERDYIFRYKLLIYVGVKPYVKVDELVNRLTIDAEYEELSERYLIIKKRTNAGYYKLIIYKRRVADNPGLMDNSGLKLPEDTEPKTSLGSPFELFGDHDRGGDDKPGK